MEKLTSLLVVVDPHYEMRQTLAKALTIARRTRARIELFLCDSDQAKVLRRNYFTHTMQREARLVVDPNRLDVPAPLQPSLALEDIEQAREANIQDGRRYLQSLKESLNAPDLDISIHVECHAPLYEAIVHRVVLTAPDLVIKTAAGLHPMRRVSWDENDWRLARMCPVSILLTRARQWRDSPRFAASVDVSERETFPLAQAILSTAEYLAGGCGADLSLLYCNPEDGDLSEQDMRASRLDQLAYEHQIRVENRHVLYGDVEKELPTFAAKQSYDVILLGALTHRRGLTAWVGAMTSKLVDTLDCDFVLVKWPDGMYR